MEALHLPDNIKVHFAGGEVICQYLIAKTLGVRYGLYTCFPFVERMVFDKHQSPIIPLSWMTKPETELPQELCKWNKHVIQDSGLFTLMFGSRKGKKDESLINKWYDALIEFTLAHGMPVTCVEVDCQKVLGVDKAWEFRERMRNDLPNNRIINVFHLEDGQKGLDRLIEFSEYIAISVPELRIANKKKFVPQLARYIKKKKPDIDIHLLGCTELALLKECNFCTSADSTTWTCHKRFGFINGHHVSTIKTDKIKEMVGIDNYEKFCEYHNEMNVNTLSLSVMTLMKQYEKAAGNQDYYYKV
jgi:hypothetical protein